MKKNGSIDEINNNLSSLADFILDSVLDADFNLLILNLFGVALVTVLKYLISDKTKSLEKN